MTYGRMPTKPLPDLDVNELLDMWDRATELERYCVQHLGYKQSSNNVLGKLKRDLADRIAHQTAVNRLKDS